MQGIKEMKYIPLLVLLVSCAIDTDVELIPHTVRADTIYQIQTSASAGLTPHWQERENWCWLAVAETIAEGQGYDNVEQCELATIYQYGDNKLDCCDPETEKMFECNHPGNSIHVLENIFNIHSNSLDKPLSENGLRIVLNSGLPVIVTHEAVIDDFIMGKHKRLQHVTIVNGYDGDKYEFLNSAGSMNTQWLTYEELLTRKTYSGEITWNWKFSDFDIK